jgi:hypothetical protein
MFKGFILWLDSHIAREEPSSIVKSMIGLLTFAGLLGTVFGNHAIRAGAFVIAVLFILSITLALLGDRRRLRKAYNAQRAQLVRYCTHLVESNSAPQLSIDCWRQWVFVQPNGDVREVLKLNAVVLGESMHFLRLTSGCRWDQPERFRRDVKVTANRLAANGTRGTHWDVTTAWQSMQKLTHITHLGEPIYRGEEIPIELVRLWPAKCLPLMRYQEVESFTLVATNRLQVQSAEYRVILPPGFDAVQELIGATHADVHLSAETEYDQEDRKVFVWRSEKIPARTAIGMRLQLIRD